MTSNTKRPGWEYEEYMDRMGYSDYCSVCHTQHMPNCIVEYEDDDPGYCNGCGDALWTGDSCSCEYEFPEFSSVPSTVPPKRKATWQEWLLLIGIVAVGVMGVIVTLLDHIQ